MRSRDTADVLIIGAAPRRVPAAIRLARLGWRVTLVSEHCFLARRSVASV